MLTLCESLEGKLSWAWRGRSRRKAEEEPRCQEGRPPAGPPGAAGLGPQERDESRGRTRPLLAADPSQACGEAVQQLWGRRPAAAAGGAGTPQGGRCSAFCLQAEEGSSLPRPPAHPQGSLPVDASALHPQIEVSFTFPERLELAEETHVV